MLLKVPVGKGTIPAHLWLDFMLLPTATVSGSDFKGLDKEEGLKLPFAMTSRYICLLYAVEWQSQSRQAGGFYDSARPYPVHVAWCEMQIRPQGVRRSITDPLHKIGDPRKSVKYAILTTAM